MGMLKKIYSKVLKIYYMSSSNRYIRFLRKNGCIIGENVVFRDVKTTRIDITRPSLVEIGNNVDMNHNFQIMTHDWAAGVFRGVFHNILPSSGKVKIGNNIYFGTDVIILKGVTIGDNCIIAAGSIVTKDIPSNSVAAGAPARVLCTLEEFYEKRRKACVEEALEYARSIVDRYNRKPTIEDFHEEFVLFTDGNDISNHRPWMISQLGGMENYKIWCSEHKAPYKDIDEFLNAASIKQA